jgi:predicted Zn-dependent peptidase
MGGSYKNDDTYLASLQSVSPQDIQRIAKKYLVADNSVQIELVPSAK